MLLDSEKEELLKTARVIAIVGLSIEREKASNMVARYLKEKGYRIIPVNPGQSEILGEKAYKSLLDIPEKVDIVDIFMRAERVLPIVEEALKIQPRAIWLQLGIKNDDARQLVEKTDIGYVEDKCLKIEYARLLRDPRILALGPVLHEPPVYPGPVTLVFIHIGPDLSLPLPRTLASGRYAQCPEKKITCAKNCSYRLDHRLFDSGLCVKRCFVEALIRRSTPGG